MNTSPPGVPIPYATSEWATPCAAWFETLASGTDENGVEIPTVLRTTLRLKGRITDRPVGSAGYVMWWTAGECRFSWYLSDRIPTGQVREWTVDCPDTGRLTTKLPGTVREFDDTVSVTLDFGRPELQEYAAAHAHDAALTEPQAAGYNDFVLWLGYPGVSFRGHVIGPGRAYTVGAK